MAEPPHNQVGMDFVADKDDVVLQAQFGNLAQFVGRPATAQWIVRVADNHQLRTLFQFLFQIVVIHHKTVAFDAERVEYQLPSVFLHHLIERRIDGRLDQHLVAFFGKILHQKRQSRHDAGREADPFGGDVPVVPPLHPAYDGVVELLRVVKIPENRMLGAFPQRIHNKVRDTEVHIGNPHGEQIITAEELRCLVVLEATRSAPVNYFVKIVVHSLLEMVGKSTIINWIRARCRSHLKPTACAFADLNFAA